MRHSLGLLVVLISISKNLAFMVNNYTLTGRPNRAETLAKLKGPLPGDTFIPLNFIDNSSKRVKITAMFISPCLQKTINCVTNSLVTFMDKISDFK